METAAVALPTWSEALAVLAASGILTYGATEILKVICRRWVGKDVNSNDPVWWQAGFRIAPIAIGFAIGNTLLGFPWGATVGACAGVVNILIYRKVTTLIDTFNMKK
jgi:hypothetical protein